VNFYSEKDAAYFSNARIEIAQFLGTPALQFGHALEIGCSQGYTLEWLKAAGYANRTTGVELYADVDVSARKIDQFLKMDVEKQDLPILNGSVDLILCLDVLEHLIDPWETIRRLAKLLHVRGTLIISVPNIRNYRILFDLAFKGNFGYTSSGILDKTHLRFFTKSSATELAQCSGLANTQVQPAEVERWQKRLFCTLGLEELITKQYFLVATNQSSSRND
jgi:2-polyprenyl-3-methyl-5-hydroxy-6-metoxy-1,4-benzoquinol methylase